MSKLIASHGIEPRSLELNKPILCISGRNGKAGQLGFGTSMGSPVPDVLFAHTFQHCDFGEHVDEVRFAEPVLISACEILDFQGASCLVPLSGDSSPLPFAVELFVRTRGEARFNHLCPAFIYSSSASATLDVQVAVTDHLVLRGIYCAVTLVIYGNPVKDLDLSSVLGDSAVPYELEDFPEAFRSQRWEISGLAQGLHHLSLVKRVPEHVDLVWQLLRLAVRTAKIPSKTSTMGVVVKGLITAALSLQKSNNLSKDFRIKASETEDKQMQEKGTSVILQVIGDVEELLQKEENIEQAADIEMDTLALEMILNWIQDGLSRQRSRMVDPADTFLGGLAAVQLLCVDIKGCFRFVAAGGMELLIEVLQHVSADASVATVLALQAVECASHHAFACEALLGWWNSQLSPNTGYSVLLILLLQVHRRVVVKFSVELLHRLHAYELAATFQATVDRLLLEISADMERARLSFTKATACLKDLSKVLLLNDADSARLVAMEFEDNGTPFTMLGGDFPGSQQDMDEYVLSLLQERRLLSSIAALLSAPGLRDASRSGMDTCIEFMGTVQSLLLSLLSCRSGIVFLAMVPEATSAVMDGLRGLQTEQGECSIPLQQAAALVALNFVCRPRDIGGLLHTTLHVVSAVDRLIGSSYGSEGSLWCLWDLVRSSRTETGRQAVLRAVQIPEALKAVIAVLDSAANLVTETQLAASHFAAEVLYILLTDSTPSVLASWIPHAPRLQHILVSLKDAEDEIIEKSLLVSRLQLLVDVAVVYQKKGAVDLMKFSASVIGGNSNPPLVEPIEPDNEMVDLPDVTTLLGKGVRSGSPVVSDTTTMQLTACLQILSSVCSPSVAATLIGEGAFPAVNALLEYCIAVLQDETFDEESVSEDLVEQFKTRSAMKLLVPTLLLLSTLFQKLQLEEQTYRNTKLVNTLLHLHRAISAKAAAHVTVPPCSAASGGLELTAVLQLLASVLAFWPVFGWSPALLPRILGTGQSIGSLISFPMDPVETSSALILLADLLPVETPQLSGSKTGMCEVYRSLSLESLLGTQNIPWHMQTPNMEKLFGALVPHLEQLAQMILRMTPTTCAMILIMLKRIVVRIACQNASHAVVLFRPVLTYIQECTSASAPQSDVDFLHVECCIQFIAELATHPATKSLLLQEESIKVLCEALATFLPSIEDVASSADANLPNSVRWVLIFFTRLCDPYASGYSARQPKRCIVDDWPKFEDCCRIASSLKSLFEVLPLGKNSEALAEAFDKFSSHRLGRAAFAATSLCLSPARTERKSSEDDTDVDIDNKEAEQPDKIYSSPLLALWKRLATALDAEEVCSTLLLGLVRAFACGALRLAAAGRSFFGLGALKLLFGAALVMKDAEDVAQQHEVVVILSLIEIIETKSEEGVNTEDDQRKSAQQARRVLQVLLRLLQKPVQLDNLTEKVQAFVDGVAAETSTSVPAVNPLMRLMSVMALNNTGVDTEDAEVHERAVEDRLGNLKDNFSWECSTMTFNRTVPKRRLAAPSDASKRQRSDISGTESVFHTGLVSASSGTLNRRDAFRQRKPNTSRPPSMHVDDYVARERGSDSNTSLQRSGSGSGRAPSIHVDEFMARQKNQSSGLVGAPQQLQSSVTLVDINVSKEGAEIQVSMELAQNGTVANSKAAKQGFFHNTNEDEASALIARTGSNNLASSSSGTFDPSFTMDYDHEAGSMSKLEEAKHQGVPSKHPDSDPRTYRERTESTASLYPRVNDSQLEAPPDEDKPVLAWRNEGSIHPSVILPSSGGPFSVLVQPPFPQSMPPAFIPPLPAGMPPSSTQQPANNTSQHLQLQQLPHLPLQQQIVHFQPQHSQFQPQHLHQQLQLPLQQEQYHIQPQIYQPMQAQQHQQAAPHPPPSQEPLSSLQQILGSPAAIQELLRDQTRLTQLLEQHPKLLSLLQEKLNLN